MTHQNFLLCKHLIIQLPHQNKEAWSPFYHKKIFLIENECKTPAFYILFLIIKYLQMFKMLDWSIKL